MQVRHVIPVLMLGFVLSLIVFGCVRGDFQGEAPQDYDDLKNDGGDGPYVMFEPSADPVPLMPFPNDMATSIDPSTPTGVRVNLDEEGDTQLEISNRHYLNQLDGFGTFTNLRVAFDRSLDLTTISDQTVFAVNVTEGSRYYGELVKFDLARGYFPIDLKSPEAFYPNDPHAASSNQLFADGNRIYDYEDETNILLLRPMHPLRQQSRYVVVLTKGLKGEDGEPVQPPLNFEWKTFPTQIDDVDRAADVLEKKAGVNAKDIAFGWRFTTLSITQPLEKIRAGLYGQGQFSYLADEFPAQIHEIHHFSAEIDHDGNDYIMPGKTLDDLIDFVDLLIGEAQGVPINLFASFHNVDYILSGSYTTPLFLGTDDRIWHMDWQTGQAEYGEEQVPFYICVPKPNAANGYAQPPYPIAMFQHANIRNRLDIIAIADALAAQGIASFAIDAAEHGPETYLTAVQQLLLGLTSPPPDGLLSMGVEAICKLIIKIFYPSWDVSNLSPDELVQLIFDQTWLGAAMHGRSYDYNHDGLLESGMSFFSANIFRTRDITRQTQVDLFLATKILKSLGTDFDGDGLLSMYEGDFNQDGVLDVGGPGNEVYFIGMSLGSLMGSGFVALEPELHTAVFNVPGGGLTDILQRTQIPNVIEPIRAELVGPVLIGRPDAVPGRVALTVNKEPAQNKFASIGVYPGAKVVLTNYANGVDSSTTMDDEGNFAVVVPADEGDLLELQVVSDQGDILERVEWASRYYGLGVERNTPKARDFVDNAQWAVDGADPVNFAPFFLDPRPGVGVKNFLMQYCNPDDRIPNAPGLRFADVAGIMDQPHLEHLLDLGVLDWAEGFTTAEMNFPYQSNTQYGWRLWPANNHEFLLAPQGEPNAIMFSFVSKNQAAIFFKTNGQVIVDDFEALVPPEWYVEGY